MESRELIVEAGHIPEQYDQNDTNLQYPNIEFEDLIHESNLEYLAPLIVILLSTLLGIIILFSCVLCTCTARSRSNDKLSKIDDIQTVVQIREHGQSKDGWNRHRHCSVPVILAYSRNEDYDQWNGQVATSLTIAAGSQHDQSDSVSNGKLPWSQDRVGNNVTHSKSETAVDRVTVV